MSFKGRTGRTKSRRPQSSYARRSAARIRATERRMRNSPYHQSPTHLRSKAASSPRRARLRPKTAPTARSRLFAMHNEDAALAVRPKRPETGLARTASAPTLRIGEAIATASENARPDVPGTELRAEDLRIGLRVVTLYSRGERGVEQLLPGTVCEVFVSASEARITIRLESGHMLREVPLSRVWKHRERTSPSERVIETLKQASAAATARRVSALDKRRRRRTIKPRTPRRRKSQAPKENKQSDPKPRPRPKSKSKPAPRPPSAKKAAMYQYKNRVLAAKGRQKYINRICLCDAVTRKNYQLVDQLLEKKMDPNFRSFLETSGATPLHLSCEKDSLLITKRLLDAKADPAFEDGHGVNAFLTAVQKDDTELVKHMMAACDEDLLNSTFPDGSTALIMSIKRGNRELTRTLLRGKCDPTTENDWGLLPLQIAEKKEDMMTIRLLNMAIGKHNHSEQLKRRKQAEAEAEEEEPLPENYNYMMSGGFEPVVQPYQLMMPYKEFSQSGVTKVHSNSPKHYS